MSNFKLWIDLPYPGEKTPPRNPVEPLAGNWPLYYLQRNPGGVFTDYAGNIVNLDIRNPHTIDFNKQLRIVRNIVKMLTPRQKRIAVFWGTGVATKQWTPIIDRLIDTYKLSAPRAARVLAATHAGINDAFIVCWFIKYRYLVARPAQLDPTLRTVLPTPRFPAYPSGHATISGAAEIILKYFFPAEAARLNDLAEEDALSRLYAGVHFMIDNTEGLRLGRQIGKIAVNALRNSRYLGLDPIDTPKRVFRNAKLPPPPYKQLIPFVDC